MAINIFKNVTKNLTIAGEEVYTAPAGYSGIVLMAQVTNVGGSTAWVSMSVVNGVTSTSLAYEFDIPPNDSAGLLTGKLVLEAGQKVSFSASDDTSLQLVMSILESQN